MTGLFQFTKPSTWKLQRTFDQVYEALLERMKRDLATTDNIAVTTDIWSTKQLIDSFLGVTAHFYNQELGRIESFRIGNIGKSPKLKFNSKFVFSLP